MYSDNEYENATIRSTKLRIRKRKSRTKDFTDEEKRILAALVRKEPALWDPTVGSRSGPGVENIWNKIGVQMGKTKEKCKLAWVALRESFRYHQRTARNSHDPLGQNALTWEFAKDLSFLENTKRLQKTVLPYIEVSNEPDMDLDSSEQSGTVKEETGTTIELDIYHKDSRTKNSDLNILDESHIEADATDSDGEYELKEQDSKIVDSSKTCSNTDMGALIYQLGKLVNAQTEFMRRIRGNSSETLTYQNQLFACDSLLQQLPKAIAEKTLVEIQNYILKKINDLHKQKQSR